MSDFDYYSDDPVNFNQPKSKKRFSGIFALIAALIGGTFYIQSTLAANISLNSGSGVEFGQGVTQTVACSGSDLITVTPIAGFVNSSGAGTFKFSSIRVDDIPAGCQGSDFAFSAYDNNAGSAAQAIFNTTSTRAVVYIKSDGTFEMGIGGTGATVTRNSSTSFTINFTSPVALSDYISKLTVESGVHTPKPCSDGGDCVVGEIGPGEGTIYFAYPNGFNCGEDNLSTCRYLEVSKNNWSGLGYDPSQIWASVNTNVTGVPDDASPGSYNIAAVGLGSKNSKSIADQLGSNTAASAARSYRGGGLSDWYLPSLSELNLLCQWARGIPTDVTASCTGGTTPSGFSTEFYNSSSEGSPNWRVYVVKISSGYSPDYSKQASIPYRPIRAF